MTLFTKTFARCDICDAERELPGDAGEWLQIRTEVRRLADGQPGEVHATRQVDLCPRCYAAIRESEFSSLFGSESDGPDLEHADGEPHKYRA